MGGDELRYVLCELDPDLTFLELYIFSDLHYGNPFCDIKCFKRSIDYVRDTPQARVIINGDLCESAIKSSKGDIHRQVGSPQDQRDWCIDTLMPIKNKVVAMTTGNHESRIYNDAGVDISKDIAKALGVYYDPDGLLIKIRFGHGCQRTRNEPYTYKIYTMHGYGGSRTRGAKAQKLERMGQWVGADVYCESHDHQVLSFPASYLEDDNRATRQDGGFKTGLMRAKRAEFVKSNAYLKWGGYARSQGFPPVDMITPVIWLGGSEKPWPGPKPKSMNLKPEIRVVS